MTPFTGQGLLAGRTVLVTGAGGGIGRGIALRFAAAGAAVALHHRTRGVDDLVEGVRASGGRAIALRADLRDEQECFRLVHEAAAWARESGGRLTDLVNNAGVQPVQALPGMTAADWREVIDTDLTSVFSCTQAAAEIMRDTARKDTDGGPGTGTRTGPGTGTPTGRGTRTSRGTQTPACTGAPPYTATASVTHIASVEAGHPAPLHAHYAAAKAAVVMHARSAALEYGPYGIRVNTVSPGLVDRDGLEEEWPEGVRRWHAAVPTGRLGRPEDIGDACVFLASPMASWISGHDLVVDGGVSARPTW